MRVHLIHGIHTGGPSPVQGLIRHLVAAGFEVIYPDYGWIAGLETRLVNPVIRGAILPYVAGGDVLIGHSNGCAIAYDLMNAGAPACGAVFINGALEQRFVRPPQCAFIDVYYNPGDDITEAAKIAEHLGIVDPVWGELGHGGYIGTDHAIVNIDCGLGTAYFLHGAPDGSPIVGNREPMPVVSGHSAFFDPPNLAAWGPFLANRLVARLKETAP